MNFEVRAVEFMPKALEPGVLYVSEKYSTAAHLCACGCGEKVRTPIGPAEWSLEYGRRGPTLSPSIGNWQRPCRSHYHIVDGRVHWAGQLSEVEVAAGRRGEQIRRQQYYDGRRRRFSFWRWLTSLFR